MTICSSLALFVFYLDSLHVAAESLLKQVSSALSVFEVEVVTHLRVIGKPVEEHEADYFHDQYVFILSPPPLFLWCHSQGARSKSDGPYHLAVVFMTEADPRGGWWISSEKSRGGSGRAKEDKFIRYHTKELTELAKGAMTSRMFMLSCATNLFNPASLGVIHDTLSM